MNGSAAQRDESAEQGSYRATGTDNAAALQSGVLLESGVLFESGAGPDNAAALKQIAAERLAAHRNRRAQVAATLAATHAEREARVRARTDALRRESSHGASRVRDAVAARYQQSVSYREYLAAQAERALEQAHAEAEVAARNAQAVAAAQIELLAELGRWSNDAAASSNPHEFVGQSPSLVERPGADLARSASAGLKVMLHEHLAGPSAPHASRSTAPRDRIAYALSGELLQTGDCVETDELDQLDREIEFRRSPGFEEQAVETQPIAANIIEFPRQLVASRKARPRLAEGPLREDASPQPQLRIFEVEAEQISIAPEVVETSGAPEWQSLLLDVAAPALPLAGRDLDARSRPQTAPLPLRLMAFAVDACCIGCALLAFAAVVAEIAGPALRGFALPALGAAAAATLLIFVVLYQMLFFSLASTTPGMRYARIGLCTFNDENPTRKAMRRRILALFLAASPLGLGLVWMALDDDRLGWHDRISRMYPRAY